MSKIRQYNGILHLTNFAYTDLTRDTRNYVVKFINSEEGTRWALYRNKNAQHVTINNPYRNWFNC